jgi:hypothetical protein
LGIGAACAEAVPQLSEVKISVVSGQRIAEKNVPSLQQNSSVRGCFAPETTRPDPIMRSTD